MYNEQLMTNSGRHRIYATNSFGPSKKSRYSFVFMKGGDFGKHQEFWFAQTKMLFHLSCRNQAYSKSLVFVKYLTFAPPTDPIDKVLNCIVLRWETADGLDYADIYKNSNIPSTISVGENYGIVQLDSLCGSVQAIRSNYCIKPFTKELPWTHHRFYVNRFIWNRINKNIKEIGFS